ncbi:uncharacterized protein LOC113331332 [Papaver somniferum]|uniref:uncharacterized protein LOC113331332 n=1 Tax=Papaver somniferum TaxID=3469 RepID=UPI000E7041E7|nr:uncharacterized protein LOC113331332 [Papaver somniferum]
MYWNIRGLGQENKITTIRNAIWKNNITLFSILESKKENVDGNLIRDLWGNVRCNYLYQPSFGASGGIIIMWKEGVLHMEDHLMGAFSLSIKFRNSSDNFSWLFTAVYAASDAAQAERNLPGGNISNRRFFKKFVNKHELVDLPMTRGLKQLIKIWKRSLGNLHTQLDQLEEMIDSWDMQEEDNNVLSIPDVVAREDAKSKYDAISLNLARKWEQRAKENWAKEAEKNSRYLHQIAYYKFICNNINCLVIDGDISYDKSKFAEEAVSFYTSIFSEEHVTRPGFDDLELPTISVSDSISLEKPFTSDEVKNVIWHFGSNKAPGPDGFTMEFFKAAWETIKDDLMNAIKEFENNIFLDWGLNCTSLKLIHKVNGVVSLHNFRPISLISGMYKILSKLAADRLKTVLPSIIVNYQGLKVNYRKSAVVGVGDEHNGAECAIAFGCQLDTFPLIYLGIPLGSKFKNKVILGDHYSDMSTKAEHLEKELFDKREEIDTHKQCNS